MALSLFPPPHPLPPSDISCYVWYDNTRISIQSKEMDDEEEEEYMVGDDEEGWEEVAEEEEDAKEDRGETGEKKA